MARPGLVFIRFVSRLPWPVGAAVSAGGFVVFFAVFLTARQDGFLLFCGISAALLGSLSAVISYLEPKTQDRSAQALAGPESLRQLGLEDFQSVMSGAYGRRGYDVIDDPEHGGARGVDVRLYKDGKLILVQTKHWREDITPGMARELCEGMAAEKAARGVLVTTSGISAEARSYVAGKPIELMDGPELWRFVNWTATPERAD
jgi:restriction system protein